MSENQYLDRFTAELDASSHSLDDTLKKRILKKTHRRIYGKWQYFKITAAACAALLILSAIIPNTPVNALYRKIFSFIPGIGVVQNSDHSIKSVLDKPVRVTDGEAFVEINAAYVSGNILNVWVKSNVGTARAEGIHDPAEIKKFFAGEATPKLYLLNSSGRVKAGNAVIAGPSFDTRTYLINAGYGLDEKDRESTTFRFEMEGFARDIEITLTPVSGGTLPDNVNHAVIMEELIVFAHARRNGEYLEVLLSVAGPDDIKNPRFYLFDEEQKYFESGVYIKDSQGNAYYPDDDVRKKVNGSTAQFYFRVPEQQQDLRLVIPQILYGRRYPQYDIRLTVPRSGVEKRINKVLELGESRVLIEKASLVPAFDALLPEEFQSYPCLKIDAAMVQEMSHGETVLRVIPDVKVYQFSHGFKPTSQSVYSGLWNGKSGYALVTFNDIKADKKIRMSIDIEYALSGPWEIELNQIDE